MSKWRFILWQYYCGTGSSRYSGRKLYCSIWGEPKYNSSEEEYVDVEIPDVTGMSKSDAGIAIDESGLEVKFSGESDLIVDQIPKAHTK